MIARNEDLGNRRRVELLSEDAFAVFAVVVSQAFVVDVIAEENDAARLDRGCPTVEGEKRWVTFEVVASVTDHDDSMVDFEIEFAPGAAWSRRFTGSRCDPWRRIRGIVGTTQAIRTAGKPSDEDDCRKDSEVVTRHRAFLVKGSDRF